LAEKATRLRLACLTRWPLAEKLAAELDGEVAVAVVDATKSKAVLSRFAEAGLVRGYPTLLLFRQAATWRNSRLCAVSDSYACAGTERCASTRVAATWRRLLHLHAR